MYHIRRVDDHDERSLHMENETGFKAAMTEAIMRTHHSGDLHEVVDDNGKRVYIVNAELLADVREKYEADVAARASRRPIPVHVFMLAAVLAAMTIHMVIR